MNLRALLPYRHFLGRAKQPCKKGWRMHPSILQSWAELEATKESRPAQKGFRLITFRRAGPRHSSWKNKPSHTQTPSRSSGHASLSEGALPRTHSPETSLESLPQLKGRCSASAQTHGSQQSLSRRNAG